MPTKNQKSKKNDTGRQTASGKWTDKYAGRQKARLCSSQPSEHWTGAPTT